MHKKQNPSKIYIWFSEFKGGKLIGRKKNSKHKVFCETHWLKICIKSFSEFRGDKSAGKSTLYAEFKYYVKGKTVVDSKNSRYKAFYKTHWLKIYIFS
jgi:hypothetical protein